MSQFRHAPPLEKLGPFSAQTIELLDGKATLARATWQPVASAPGAYALLWAEVAPDLRRRGNGSLVLGEAIREAQRHAKSIGRPMRRLMALIPQPNVNGRAWLVRNGFVHVNTINDLAADGEVLLMLRTFS